MIGQLPTALEVGGKAYAIRSDYRVILTIFQAFNDPELTNDEKCYVCMKCLYVDFENNIPPEYIQEAAEKAYWFCDGGDMPKSDNVDEIKTFDWEQDEGIMFPAINKAAGFEVRAVEYLHWWTFLGLFGVVDDGLFSQVLHLRNKLAKGKKLDKTEREFYRDHRSMVDLKQKLTAEQKEAEERDQAFLRELLGE
jgi:Pyruvate/2-oxoacid:ferredoxin oxidoreductase delta subunit